MHRWRINGDYMKGGVHIKEENKMSKREIENKGKCIYREINGDYIQGGEQING